VSLTDQITQLFAQDLMTHDARRLFGREVFDIDIGLDVADPTAPSS